MKKFKDNNNSEWEIAINVAAVRKVRNILNADLLDIQTTMPRLLADPIFLVDVIYVLCQSQANECNISDEQLVRRWPETPWVPRNGQLIRYFATDLPPVPTVEVKKQWNGLYTFSIQAPDF